MPMYRCGHCNSSDVMQSSGDRVFCVNCGRPSLHTGEKSDHSAHAMSQDVPAQGSKVDDNNAAVTEPESGMMTTKTAAKGKK